MVDVLQVFQLLQLVHQTHDLLRIRQRHFRGVGRDHGEFRALRLHALGMEGFLHGRQVSGAGVDDPFVFGIFVIVTAGFRHGHHEIVFVSRSAVRAGGVLLVPRLHFLRDHDLALLLELEGHRTGGAQAAARMGEGAAHVSCGAVAVVRQGFAVHGDARRAVPLIHHRLVVRSVLAGAERFIDGGLDLVLGKRIALGLFDGSRQRSIVVRVRVSTFLRRHGDVARKLGEERRPLRILCRFAMLGGGPL